MFELGTIDDLIVPGARSTTGRALASMARRRTFEQLKALAREGHPDDSVAPWVDELARSFARRLPGDPHAISDAITDPAIGLPLRRGLRGEPGAPQHLALGLERLLVALGDRPAREAADHRVAIEGFVSLRFGDAALARCAEVSVEAQPPVEPLRLALNTAVVTLAESTPGVYADLPRFATAALVSTTRPDALPPYAIGLALVPDAAEPAALVGALVASVAVGKLHALVDGRAHDATLLARLRPLVVEASVLLGLPRAIDDAAIASRRGALRVAALDLHTTDDDPLAHVVRELRARAGSENLSP